MKSSPGIFDLSYLTKCKKAASVDAILLDERMDLLTSITSTSLKGSYVDTWKDSKQPLILTARQGFTTQSGLSEGLKLARG